jgi:hypothetical protein
VIRSELGYLGGSGYHPKVQAPWAGRAAYRRSLASLLDEMGVGLKAVSPVVRGQDARRRRGKQRQTVDNKYVAGVAQWQSEGLIIPRPWVRFPPPAPKISKDLQ